MNLAGTLLKQLRKRKRTENLGADSVRWWESLCKDSCFSENWRETLFWKFASRSNNNKGVTTKIVNIIWKWDFWEQTPIITSICALTILDLTFSCVLFCLVTFVFLCVDHHIQSVLIGVEYRNFCRTLDVYLHFAIWMGQIQSKLIYVFVTYGLASL